MSVQVIREAGGHGFPWRAICSRCAWRSSGYCAEHAARDMAEAHLAESHGTT